MDKGKIAQARRLLKGIDDLIVLLSDEHFLEDIPYKNIQVIECNLRQSHTACTNILYDVGDMGSYPLPVPPRPVIKEHWM